MTFDEFKIEINSLRKNKKNAWYFWNGDVEGKTVQLKGYGTWLQIYKVDGISYGGAMDINVSAFNKELEQPFSKKMEEGGVLATGDDVEILGGKHFAKGGSVGLDSVEDTMNHLGYEDEDWNELSDEEKISLRRTSYEHLVLGKRSDRKKKVVSEAKEVKSKSGWFEGSLSFINW